MLQNIERILLMLFQIEVKLKKADGIRWQALESEKEPQPSEGKFLQYTLIVLILIIVSQQLP